ncbi:AHH domain-containing protein [Bacteroides fragilis]|uniref:AHH domain-containing protein n=1 Tax=Bacteroides fragilis TaxID=817 RepID=UPI00216AE735|nr:AHH domain-containing protein [Bacteroides fragilis]
MLGLDLHHIIPQAVWRKINKEFDNALKNIEGYVQNVTKKAVDISNLIDLDKPFHGNHPSYSEFVERQLKKLIGDDNLNLSSVKKLQDELRSLIDKAKELGKNLNDYFADDVLPKCK